MADAIVAIYPNQIGLRPIGMQDYDFRFRFFQGLFQSDPASNRRVVCQMCSSAPSWWGLVWPLSAQQATRLGQCHRSPRRGHESLGYALWLLIVLCKLTPCR